MKSTSAALAPAKGPIMRRILHPDFLGINWTSISFRTPFSNCYPVTLSSGNYNRLWSNPVTYGFFPNRMHRLGLRMYVLLWPTFILIGIVFFQPDVWAVYSGLKIACDELMIPFEIPESILEKRRQDNYVESRIKPGAHMKHRYGGQVSIPGSADWME